MSLLSDTAGAASPAPARRRDIAGVHNFRDTGGHPAASGRSRWGVLFRSDALHRLDEAGRIELATLGISRVVDLRGERESEAAPSALADLEITVHPVPVFDDADPAAAGERGVSLAGIYDHMVDERGLRLVAAVRVIADAAPGEAVLVHCTAGKDRTGLVVALALSTAGVDRAAVVADYAASADHLRGAWTEQMLAALVDRGLTPTPEIVELVTASPAALLERLLDRIDAEYGSPTAYLQAHGLTDDERDRLRAALVVGDDDDDDERTDS